jgi:hypothetical protein
MRPSSLLLSLAVAAAALVAPAVGRLNYFKGLTTVEDLETLRLLDDQGTCRAIDRSIDRLIGLLFETLIDSGRYQHALIQAASASTPSWPSPSPTTTAARHAPSTSSRHCAFPTSSSTCPALSSK